MMLYLFLAMILLIISTYCAIQLGFNNVCSKVLTQNDWVLNTSLILGWT